MSNVSPLTWMWISVATIVLAALSGIAFLMLDKSDREQRRRLEAFRGPINSADTSAAVRLWYHQLGIWFAPLVGVVERQRLLKSLAQAGFKKKASLTSFIATKVVAAMIFAGLAWIIIKTQQLPGSVMVVLATLCAGLILGWRAPDIVLNRLIARRRLRLENGMPDALDLLVICAESGLSLNQAVEEISHQLRLSNKDTADEFAATSAEMRITPDFGKALDNMVERTGLKDLGGLVATLKQSIKFGTPLAESLRTIAAEMRAERQARIEERAARLPVLLAVPMMLFILPCLMMVVATPVVLRLVDTFKNVTLGGFGVH